MDVEGEGEGLICAGHMTCYMFGFESLAPNGILSAWTGNLNQKPPNPATTPWKTKS